MLSPRLPSGFTRFVCRLSLFLGAGVSLATLAGLFGWLHWTLNLFSHFSVQYLVIAIMLMPLAIFFGRWYLWVGGTTLIALINLGVIWPFLQQSASPAVAAGQGIEILLWNIWRKNERWPEIEDYIRSVNGDIVILQETGDAVRARVDALEDRYDAYIHQDNVLLIAHSLGLASVNARPLPSGYASEVRLALDGAELSMLTTHLPTPILPADVAARALQIDAMRAWTSGQTSEHLLIGDFNMTPWSHEHRKLLEDAGLQDSMIGFGIQASWPFHNTLTSLFRIPLDHCLVSSGLMVSRRELGDAQSSNHRPLLIRVHRINGSSEISSSQSAIDDS